MKIAIEIPSWLGDAVMVTPSIENIVAHYPQCELTIFGSFISTRLFLHHPNVTKIIVDESKKKGFRFINLYRYAKGIGRVDRVVSFRRNFTTKFWLFFVDAPLKDRYRRYTHQLQHQVLHYNDFINHALGIQTTPQNLKIYTPHLTPTKPKKLLGINPGATYGSAKRWYPSEFAKVAIALHLEYDIVIFGGANEEVIAHDIESHLIESGITNYRNLAGKTTVEELIESLASLDLFITNDSGPMHIAAAFGVPTVSIFGPTNHIETHQWGNPDEMLVRIPMECAPCMKRTCPLGHHECMKGIKAEDILATLRVHHHT